MEFQPVFVFVTFVLLLPTNADQCYKLALQWPKTFCLNNICKAGIKTHEFTIHGLWGYDNVTNKPSRESCAPPLTSAQQNNLYNNYPALVNQMRSFWPNLISTDMGLWSHEWNKHGSCLFLNDPPLYFQSAIDVMNLIDPSKNLVDILAAQGVVSGAAMAYTANQFQWAVFREIHVIPFIANTPKINNISYLSEVRICADTLKHLINCSSTFSPGGTPPLAFP